MRYKIVLILDNDDGKGPARQEVVVIAREDGGASLHDLRRGLSLFADAFVAMKNENSERPRAAIIPSNTGRRTYSKNQNKI